MDKKSLGKRIREARLKNGYTQERLSEAAEITVVYLSEIERGIKLPSLSLFVRLSEILHTSADALLRDTLDSGKTYTYIELTRKLDTLTPRQRMAVSELIDTYIRTL